MESALITKPARAVVFPGISPRSTPDPALAGVLARLREERGLSQEQLAHAAGLTTSAYNRIERDHAAPGWSTVLRIALALEVSLSDLARRVEAERGTWP